MVIDGSEKPRLIIILGPTGVGKTAMALELAGRWRGEIVSADSMQVYRGMDIGTAKPTPAERQRIPHHLLDVVDPDESFDVSRYVMLARECIARLDREKKPIFIVGGTGLYLRALVGGLIGGPGADASLRGRLNEEAHREGLPFLYERLRLNDEKAAARINPHDRVRIVRALEVLELTGRSIVDYQTEHRFRERPYECVKIGLRLERETLHARIASRTDRMIADGFVEEVRSLLDKGYHGSLKPMQSLGYRHIVAYLSGEGDLERAVRRIKRDTCRYEKRQMTWFAADREITWVPPGDCEAVASRIRDFLEKS
jgi:tRNA dimethylallyltransferase